MLSDTSVGLASLVSTVQHFGCFSDEKFKQIFWKFSRRKSRAVLSSGVHEVAPVRYVNSCTSTGESSLDQTSSLAISSLSLPLLSPLSDNSTEISDSSFN